MQVNAGAGAGAGGDATPTSRSVNDPLQALLEDFQGH